LSDEKLVSLIRCAESGDDAGRDQLFASLYHELHSIARRELLRAGSSLMLGATTLLHEAYLNLGERRGLTFPDHARFLTYASRAMRGLILNHARSRRTLKRGGAFVISQLPEEVPDVPDEATNSEGLRRLGAAMEELSALEPRLAQVVDLKYFGGFSFSDIAAMSGLCERTVQRDWRKARLFLHRALSDLDESSREENFQEAPAALTDDP
jgi:RNA polymerase sigma factor (TIGR02999 family)